MIVVAKAAVASCFGLVMGIAGMAAGLGGAVLGGLDAGDTSGMATTALWGLLLTSMAPLFGLGVGMIVRHSAAAISIVLVWALVAENLIQGLRRRRACPASCRSAPPTACSASSRRVTSPATLAVALSRVHDALLFGGYSLLAVAIGTVLLYRRDTA